MRRSTFIHRSSIPEPRKHLISAGLDFVVASSQLPGVERVALVGSICTTKPNPKDVDLLVTIAPSVNMERLATLGRKLKGRAQNINCGADIFLADPAGRYLGRTCSYKECRPRMSCTSGHCGAVPFLCDDLHDLNLDRQLIANPKIVLHPEIIIRGELPEDLMNAVKTRFGNQTYSTHKISIHEHFSVALRILATHRGRIEERLLLAGKELAEISEKESDLMPESLRDDFKKFMGRLTGHGPIPETVDAFTEEEAEVLARHFWDLWERFPVYSSGHTRIPRIRHILKKGITRRMPGRIINRL